MPEIRQEKWDELKLLQDSVMKIWSIFVNWFTWSLGANLLAISWIITAQHAPNTELIAGLGVVMSIALALSIFGCSCACRYFSDAERRARSLMAGDPDFVRLVLGGALARSASWLIPVTLAVVLLAWLAVVYKYASWSAMAAWFK